MEKDLPLLDMTLALPTRDLADRLSRRWPAAAPAFYGFLMRELGGDFSPETPAAGVLPEGSFISRECAQGCILHLQREKPGTPAFSMSLQLPTESMALFFAGRWEEKADHICTFLMDRLSEN